ncbi:MAG: hypothetical protein M3Q49_06410 [Actinomycetota bacterium]|nr:hypothetical protein [Actinomycetota bacterium]
MANPSLPPPDDLNRIRSALLALLRDHRPDEKGYGRVQAAILEAAADYHWFVFPDDEEVVNTWKEFYGRVVTASGA